MESDGEAPSRPLQQGSYFDHAVSVPGRMRVTHVLSGSTQRWYIAHR